MKDKLIKMWIELYIIVFFFNLASTCDTILTQLCMIMEQIKE